MNNKIKVVILAGGLGSRLAEETHLKPKPMIEIGSRPILWHIMKHYSTHGLREFIICCGYKGYMIKEYFSNYFLHMSDVTFDIAENSIEIHQRHAEPWKVTVVDTGSHTLTGGRLRRIKDYLKNEEMFCMTYGDGVSDVNITSLLQFHKNHGKDATVTAVKPPGRYGALEVVNNGVTSFAEKPPGDGGLINGGFFVLSPRCIDLVSGDDVSWEGTPCLSLSSSGQLMAFEHHGFWHAMDTMRDVHRLRELWASDHPPWRVWPA